MKKVSIVRALFTDFSTLEVGIDNDEAVELGFAVKDSDGNDVPIGGVKISEVPAPDVNVTFIISLRTEIDIVKAYDLVCSAGESKAAVRIKRHRLYDTEYFNDRYNYDGMLGVIRSPKKAVFTVWSPVASSVILNIYEDGTRGNKTEYEMTRGDRGEWSIAVRRDLKNRYYTYSVTVDGVTREVVDPYARSAGKNGCRGMIVDLDATDPAGWDAQNRPSIAPHCKNVIYEAHIRDLTIHPSSDVSVENRGKYLGFAEHGEGGRKTALDRVCDLGVTAVHFQPFFDFASVDECFSTATYAKADEYNWGYDPLNYNVPEGSYSSDPADGRVRITELKRMIMALHNAGIAVISDMVYNHVYNAVDSNFEALVPGYYFRTDLNGNYLNGSGCGNETASERHMFRRFMIDSVTYWAQEYLIDGFRFDVMGLHDVDTMNAVVAALHEINPDILVYGEGWDAGSNGLPESARANMENAKLVPDIAMFNDAVRDGLKGGYADMTDTGFVSGKDLPQAVYAGAAGGTEAVDPHIYDALCRGGVFADPCQSINYVACHDNATVWDKINASVAASPEVLKAINRMAAVAVMTSQGISFMLAGEELLRSKPTSLATDGSPKYDNRPYRYLANSSYLFADNSYASPDPVNAIDWTFADVHADMSEFYKGLIGIKKTFPMFSIERADILKKCLYIPNAVKPGIATYAVKAPDGDEFAVVIFNNRSEVKRVDVPFGKYNIYVKSDEATFDREEPLAVFMGDEIAVVPHSAVVMTAKLNEKSVKEWAERREVGKKIDMSYAAELGIGLPDVMTLTDKNNDGGDDVKPQ